MVDTGHATNGLRHARATGKQSAIKRRLRRWLSWIVRLRASPEEIGRGAAIGIFISLTPTVGFQVGLAALLATLLGGNRAIAVMGVWITNPFTIPVIFTGTYLVGAMLWPGPELHDVGSLVARAADSLAVREEWQPAEQVGAIIEIGWDVLLPLTLGGTVLGALAAAAAYLTTVPLVRGVRRRRFARLVQRAKRRAERAAERAASRTRASPAAC